MKSDELQHCFKVKMTQKYMFYLKYNHTNWKSNIANIRDDLYLVFYAEIAKAKMEAKHLDRSNFSMKSKNMYKNWNNFTHSN